MPLSAAGLATAIKNELDSRSPAGEAETGESGDAWRQDFADAIATAVVSYLRANAVVTVAGVQAGPGAAQGTIT